MAKDTGVELGADTVMQLILDMLEFLIVKMFERLPLHTPILKDLGDVGQMPHASAEFHKVIASPSPRGGRGRR